ncbi:glycosyltransferase, partial [Candidatus Aerophobetes bacterium]|nr:glycosyltransferase [Candidatus Aerophobetes bacterium]
QNKILEAMALRKAVVTTSLGALGIKGKDGEHFLVADRAEEMTERILSLLEDREKRKSMGKKARALIEKEYTWGTIGEKFLTEIEQII